MKEFKPGKRYLINKVGKGSILVLKRTANYIYFTSNYSGTWKHYKKWIYKDNLFNLGENIYLDSFLGNGSLYFCFAAKESEP